MKKIVVILLLLIYGSSTMGATIELHYCMNEFVGASFGHSQESNECGKCGMKEKKGGCCKDEHKQLKLSTDQNHQIKTIVFEQFFATAIPLFAYNNNFCQSNSVAVTLPKNNAPPPLWRNVPIYLSNCAFLI